MAKLKFFKLNKINSTGRPSLSRGKSARQGFTLTEVLVALAIITLVIFSVISIFPSFFNYSFEFVQKTIAVNLAQTLIEENISKTYNQLTVGSFNQTSLSNYGQDFSGFSSVTNIAYVDSNLQTTPSDTGLLKISVTVSWKSRATSLIQNETLNTLLTKYQ